MDKDLTRQIAESKLQKSIKDANRHHDNWSLHSQQKATEIILNAKIEFNNNLAEIGDISMEEAFQRNAELQYQLRINKNQSLRMGNAPATTVMADLYDAQMEYLENIKKINELRDTETTNSDDWRLALIQQYMDIENLNPCTNDKSQNKETDEVRKF